MKTIIMVLSLIMSGCSTPSHRVDGATVSTEDAIRQYIFLHLSDQRPSLQSTQNTEVSVVISNDTFLVEAPASVTPRTPDNLTIGGIPLEKYRRELQGNRLIFLDPAYFPKTNNAFLFPSGGWPHWFSITVDANLGDVLDHFQPSDM